MHLAANHRENQVAGCAALRLLKLAWLFRYRASATNAGANVARAAVRASACMS